MLFSIWVNITPFYNMEKENVSFTLRGVDDKIAILSMSLKFTRKNKSAQNGKRLIRKLCKRRERIEDLKNVREHLCAKMALNLGYWQISYKR